MTENYKLISDLAKKDVATLEEKGKSYGGSWKKRGGVGAFMMLARKWDRIETICKERGYDIFDAVAYNFSDIQDDIKDLRAYLLLVEAHVESELRGKPAQAAPKSDSVHELHARLHQCPTCGAPGNHAGHTCPRALEAKESTGMEPQPFGYVDQDHDPYSRK